jgi:phosphoribosylanthranilate isomerase
MRRWTRISTIKICGLSRPEDIAIVNRVLPDFIGFVFAKSRRRIDTATAAKLKERLDPQIQAVGVFVNEDVNTIANLYLDGIIDLIQLHGDEDTSYIQKLRQCCGGKIIKAVKVGTFLPPWPENADYLLFDTAPTLSIVNSDGKVQPPAANCPAGGTGQTFDWNLLKGFTGTPYFLAGGLTINNVGQALRQLSPFCVDVSSGVETGGIKDAAKIDTFVRLIRQRRHL